MSAPTDGILRCTLPKKNGEPCGARITGMTGLQELSALGRHLRSHQNPKKAHIVVCTTSTMNAREAMEQGQVPPHYVVPRDVCECNCTDLKHHLRTYGCKTAGCKCGMFRRRKEG